MFKYYHFLSNLILGKTNGAGQILTSCGSFQTPENQNISILINIFQSKSNKKIFFRERWNALQANTMKN